MMSLNKIGFIHFIDERSAAGKYLTYFTENKKMIEDKQRSVTDISTDPYRRCLASLLQNSPQNQAHSERKTHYAFGFSVKAY